MLSQILSINMEYLSWVSCGRGWPAWPRARPESGLRVCIEGACGSWFYTNNSRLGHRPGCRRHGGPSPLAGMGARLSLGRTCPQDSSRPWLFTAQRLFLSFSLCRISRLPRAHAGAQITFLKCEKKKTWNISSFIYTYFDFFYWSFIAFLTEILYIFY